MGEMNFKRAAWALEALEEFCVHTGQDLRHEKQEAIGDLICDLLHLANQSSMDAEVVHQHALDMYQGEIHDDE